MRPLLILWRFSRPHTLIGSTLSITALYLIAGAGYPWQENLLTVFLPALVSALACNIYITGLNQYTDIEVDRINKPWLPIAAGDLAPQQALTIVSVCGVLSLALAFWQGWGLGLLIFAILAIGTAYSVPPLKFKRNHFLAAGAITLVRGILVNLGFFAHFRLKLSDEPRLEAIIWPLTAFVALFSLGIAWFKDIPDTKGDEAFRFGTLAIRLGRRFALWAGVAVVGTAYLGVAVAAMLGFLPSRAFFALFHLLPLLVFITWAWRLDVEDDKQVKRFYLFFWVLFFIEYIVYPAGILMG